jgi:hypothetical protein
VVHDIPSQVDIQPIAAVDEASHMLYVEVLNQTRQAHTIAVVLSPPHTASGPTATLRQFVQGSYDVVLGTVAITAGPVTFALPGLSIMQVIVPLVVP